MRNPIHAILIADVYFSDFTGHRHVRRAGELVLVSEVCGGVRSTDRYGTDRGEEPGAFIASIGELSFEVSREQFRLES